MDKLMDCEELNINEIQKSELIFQLIEIDRKLRISGRTEVLLSVNNLPELATQFVGSESLSKWDYYKEIILSAMNITESSVT